MGSFILHIVFSGLIAFIPSQNGTEMDVVLLSAGDCAQHYHMSDGTALPPHKPLVFARGGSCTGDCPTNDSAIAAFMYPDQSSTAALASLEAAIDGGGAWLLDASDLTLRKGSTSAADLPSLTIETGDRAVVNGVTSVIPTTATERRDFSWVAALQSICPDCTFKSALTSSTPPEGLVVARFKLRSGNLFTYSVARIGSDVTPVNFRRLDGTGSVSTYSQAIATWVGADIEVTGDSIDLVETKFDGDPGRTMHLTPDEDGKIELAVVNLPSRTPPLTTGNPSPAPGKHFELYYDLADNAPAREERLVPFAGPASTVGSYPQVSWATIHPTTELWSDLLNGLRLNVGRGPDDRILCPPTH
ncbi:MAG: hypothetical protein JO197_01125 [Acidobacteria bacterium]|nr:hypothetical protein [Acidobacteriota bacterium]MBV9476282.1 hypothetical protein [Acidobacteriota bacterium]